MSRRSWKILKKWFFIEQQRRARLLLSKVNDLFSGAALAYDFTKSTTPLVGPAIPMTRATSAMQYNAQGLRERAPENLLSYSEDFSNSTGPGWVKRANYAVSAYTGDLPPGVSQAFLLINSGNVALAEGMWNNTTSVENGLFTDSIWIKAGSVSTALICIKNASSDTIVAQNVISLTSNWVRYPVTGTTNGANTGFRVEVGTYGNTGNIVVAGAQVERYGSARSYNPTTGSPYYGPRIDYSPTLLALPRYLKERQATNRILRSNSLSDSAWSKNVTTITPNARIGASGNMDMDMASQSTTSAYIRQVRTFAAGTQVVMAADFAFGTGEWARMSIVDNTDTSNQVNLWFNLKTGVMGQVTQAGTATSVEAGFEMLPNNIYRLWLTGIIGTATQILVQTRIAQSDGSTVADAAGIFYQGCCQLEEGKRPTSYIPTEASEVTRAADNALTNDLSAINQNAGTFYAECETIDDTNTTVSAIRIDDGTSSNCSLLRVSNGGANQLRILLNGAAQASLNVAGALPNVFYKLAGSYALDNFNFSRNGSVPISDNSGTPPTGMNRFILGSDSNSNSNNMWISKFGIWNYERPNDLQTMSSSPSATLFADSIGNGSFATPQTTNRWFTQLCKAMGWVEDNKSLGGSTLSKRTPVNPFGTTNMVDRVTEIPQYVPGNKLFFAYGMNDWLTAAAAYTPTAYVQDYRTVLNYAITQRGWPRSEIYLVTPSYPTDAAFATAAGMNGGNTPTRANIQLFTQATINVSGEYSVKVINMYNPMATTSGIVNMINTDGVHPLNRGHQLMYSIAKGSFNE